MKKLSRILAPCLSLLGATGAWAQWQSMDLSVSDMVYDEVRERIYVSVLGSQPGIGNSIAVINPYSAQVESSTPVPGEPSKLALSPTNDTLYFGLNGQGRVGLYDVAGGTFVGSFPLGNHKSGPLFWAKDIEVVPGTENTIAVVLSYGSSHGGVAIFHDGIQLPEMINENIYVTAIEFADTPNRLYGFNTRTSEDGFRRLDVDAEGVIVVDTEYFQLGNEIYSLGGRIIGVTGYAVDPEPMPLLAGRYPQSGKFAGSPQYDYAYFLTNGTLARVVICDLDRFVFVRERQLPELNASSYSFLRWGESGIALHTNQGKVYIDRSSAYWRQSEGELISMVTGPGSVGQGTLESIRDSDDDWLVAIPGAVFSSQQAPLRLTTTFLASNVSSHLSVAVESRSTTNAMSQTVLALNRQTNQYEVVGQRPIGLTEGVHSIDIFDDADRFIEPATKEVSIRVEYKATGPVFMFPWRVSIDQIKCMTPQES